MANRHHPNRLGCKNRLSTALGLALGLTLSAAATGQTRIEHASDLGRGMQVSHLASPGVAHATAATIPVSNCNDSGSGSLRWAIGQAASGDTVDLGGLSCSQIKLNSLIVTYADNLTIHGDMTQKYGGTPFPAVSIDGQSVLPPLVHQGTGTLTLQGVSVAHGQREVIPGHNPRGGGCVYSRGDVALLDSAVKYCDLTGTESDPDGIGGGAIRALQDVTLSNSLVMHGTVTNQGDGDARGGGIMANRVEALNGSVITLNTATTGSNGDALGGGLHATSLLHTKDATIKDNEVSGNGNARGFGGGAYSTGYAIVEHTQVTGNSARSAGGRIGAARRRQDQVQHDQRQ